MGRYSVKQVPPNVARDARSIIKGDKKLDHPFYVAEERRGTGKATCRQCGEVIKEGEPTIYFHYAPEDDNVWIRTRGTIHADDCEGGKDEWTKCPKCMKQIERSKWSDHWKSEKGKKSAKDNPSPLPKGYQPRVDPYQDQKLEETQKDQLDDEARKLQRNIKGLDQFAGFKNSATVNWNDEAEEFLGAFWEKHSDLRKKCEEKYGHDPVDEAKQYWISGLKEEPEHEALWNKSKDETLSLSDAKTWSKAELEAQKKTAGWRTSQFIKQAGTPHIDIHAMKIDEDEKEFTVIPKEIPTEVPRKNPIPVKEPVREPAKVPARTAEADDQPPGEITPEGKIVGYKYFHVKKDDEGNWRLHSPATNRTEPWPKGALDAVCAEGKDHVAPAPKSVCNCGFHMCHSEDSPTLGSYKSQAWMGRLEGWGEPTENGGGVRTGSLSPDVIRAQHVQVVGLRPPQCEQCENTATHIITANPNALSGRPTCDEHKPEFVHEKETGKQVGILAHNVSEVAGKLSNYYQGLTIKGHGESWGEDADFSQWDQQLKSASKSDPFVGFKNTTLAGWKSSRIVKQAVRKRDWWNNPTSPYSLCDNCGGTGKTDRHYRGDDSCYQCEGSGIEYDKYNTNEPVIPTARGLRANPRIQNEYSQARGSYYPEKIKDCHYCKGEGKRWSDYKNDNEDCWSCSGSGKRAYSDPRDFLEHALSSYKGNRPIVGVQRNTGVHEDQDAYHLRLHDTDILSFHKEKPEVSIRWNGWDRQTTKQRTNSYLPDGISVRREQVRPGKGYGNHDLIVSTPTAAYKMRDGITVNYETGKADGEEMPRCKECGTIRGPDEMIKHQKRHDTYRKNFQSNPFKQCQSCQGSGSTKPWSSSCKRCKGTGSRLDWQGEATEDSCWSCKGSGEQTNSARDSGLDYMGRGEATGTCADCNGAGKVMKRKPREL